MSPSRAFHGNSGRASSASAAASAPVPVSSGRQDDVLTQAVFDDTRVWDAFRLGAPHTVSTGLFMNSLLARPEGFEEFTKRNLRLAAALAEKVSSAEDGEDLRAVIQDLDRMSDLLCSVIDMSEFIRTMHPDTAFVEAAENAYDEMFEFMNTLNVHVGLYQTLKRVLASDLTKSMKQEELAVAMIFLRDFERSGIDLPLSKRDRFVSLSSKIAGLGQRFLRGAAPKQSHIPFRSNQLKGMDPESVSSLSLGGIISMPTTGAIANTAMRSIDSEDVRKELYVAGHTSTDQQISTLESLLQARADMANLLGRKNYSEVALEDKMARGPDKVKSFLTSLAKSNLPHAQRELDILMGLKRQHKTNEFAPWDRDYYAARFLQSKRSRIKSPDFLSNYFSLGTVMQGLSRLFSHLYGVRFVPRPTQIGEIWHPDVRRIDVECEDEGLIGVMYCDLFQRDGKNPNPAHFTVRCSRRMEDGDEEAAPQNIGTTCVRGADGKMYQLPTIALVCDFASQYEDRPTLLSHHEVETLFHEMGHAIHSMLGRTAFHNVAGTRCATDFVELPSVLMEHFAYSPQVLGLFARHYRTGQPLPHSMLQHHVDLQSTLRATENHAQILMAMLDHSYHSTGWDHKIDSIAIWQGVEEQWGLLSPVAGTSWQGFFGHLFGYGGTYYSYLFDRAIAAKLWSGNFAADPLSRDAGEKYRRQVLCWGGSRDPWVCIAGVLDMPQLEAGDAAAMSEIGHWGSELNAV